MSNLLYSLISVIVVSLISLIGLFALSVTDATLDRILFYLVSLAAGSILGAALLDLLPEAVKVLGEEQLYATFLYVTLGFLGFFFLERFIYWFHGDAHLNHSPAKKKKPIKEFVYLNLLGDGIHNFSDGVIIAVSFLINISLGITTTIAVIFHEIPQEIGDFGILVYGGLTRYKALFLNFLTALTAVAGVFISTFLLQAFHGVLLAFGAGGFIYLAATELIPEILKKENTGNSAIQFALVVAGVILISSLSLIFPA